MVSLTNFKLTRTNKYLVLYVSLHFIEYKCITKRQKRSWFLRHFLNVSVYLFKQVSIPVGCVPPAWKPYVLQ